MDTRARRVACSLIVALLALCALPSAYAAIACSAAETQSYLAEGTDYRFTPKQVDYVIVIDRSGSMEGAKLDTVKRAAKTLVTGLGVNDRAAVISFNFESSVDQALTSDKQLLLTAIDGIQASFSTKYGPALRASTRAFTDTSRDRAIIFLSDGRGDFSETPQELRSLTSALGSQGICVLTISYALGEEESEQLRTMAEIGNGFGCGEHFIASEKGTELEEVFTSIRERLSSTDILSVKPKIINGNYEFSFVSMLNNQSVPGSSAVGCAEYPEFTMTVQSNGKTVHASKTTNGTVPLPAGVYTYNSIATMRCNGECLFSGERSGTFTITGECNPSYAQLATYVTGDTQMVRITGLGFSPRAIAAKQGTPVIWNNSDTVPRRVSSAFFNVTIMPGSLFTHIVDNIGTLIFFDPDTNESLTVNGILTAGSDVLLVIDESGSMKGAPIEEAKFAAKNFFRTLSPTDRGALITFSQSAQVVQGFTSDRATLIAAADTLRSEAATSYLSALRMVEEQRPTQRPILVFMSDGAPTDSEGVDAILAQTKILRDKGWCIMTVGFGESGVAAQAVLTDMAGEDACSGFLYATGGELARTFGSIYQLAQRSDDLRFEKLSVPRIVFSENATIITRINTKTGQPVPGGDSVCSPAANVQVRTHGAASTLSHNKGIYSGSIILKPGFSKVQLIASVVSVDEPSRPLVGTQTEKVLFVTPWVALLIGALIIGGIVILVLRIWLWFQTSGEEI